MLNVFSCGWIFYDVIGVIDMTDTILAHEALIRGSVFAAIFLAMAAWELILSMSQCR